MADYTDIDKLRELDAAATPGEWELHTVQPDMGGNHQYGLRSVSVKGPAGAIGAGTFRMRSADANLIAAARNALPALLAEIDEVHAERDAALAEVDQLRTENASLRESAETATFAANRLGEIANVTEERREDDRLHYDAEANTLLAERDALQAEVESVTRYSRENAGRAMRAEIEAARRRQEVAALQAQLDAVEQAAREHLPEAVGHNTLAEILAGIARQRDWQREQKVALQACIDAALAELREQWQRNHFENCGKVPFLHDGDCYWPMPESLAALGVDPQREVDTRN